MRWNWQVAYVVISRQMWKHYGTAAIPVLQSHYEGMKELMGWFERHADPSDGLLSIGCYGRRLLVIVFSDWNNSTGTECFWPKYSRVNSPCGAGDWMGVNPDSGNHGSSHLTPPAAATAFVHVLARGYMSTVSQAIGMPSNETAKWDALYKAGQAAYHARYYNATVGGYSPCINNEPPYQVAMTEDAPTQTAGTCFNTSSRGSQTSNAMALAIGAPPTPKIAQQVHPQHPLGTRCACVSMSMCVIETIQGSFQPIHTLVSHSVLFIGCRQPCRRCCRFWQ